MARSTYRPDHAGTRRLMTGPAMQAMLQARAEKGAAEARATAPRQSGDYAAGIEVDSTARGGPRRDRAEARIVATVPHSVSVEIRHRVLGHAVDAAERG